MPPRLIYNYCPCVKIGLFLNTSQRQVVSSYVFLVGAVYANYPMTLIKGAERSILSFYLKLAPNQRMPNVFMLFSLWQGEPKALLFPPGLSISMPISAMFPCLEKLSIKFLTKMLIHGTPCYRVMSGFSEAMKCAFEMLSRADVRPDFHTFPSVLKACYTLLDGERLHCWVLKLGFEWDVFVAASLLHMYCRFGFAGRAYTIFKDIPFRDTGCWNSMISGFLQNGDAKEALSILDDMILEGICLDSVTAATILSICAQLNDIIRGMLVHLYVIKHGYAQNGFASEATEVYRMMKERDVKPNKGTWVSILPAYAHLGALRDGMRIHGQVLKENLELEVFVGTCLIDLYGKCGRLSEATSLKLWGDMLEEGVKPDHVTFLSLLNACSHAGLVDQRKWCFHVMQQECGIRPTLKHYGCMVDMFGRAGLLETAYSFIEIMPLRPDASIWGALLGACRIHGNVEMGRKASNHLIELNSEDVGHYVLMSNLYANFGR
ncbi:hypothetical protein ACS0TY_017609 [Phlomoides rotata]